jgi:hypothetical protein
MSNDKRYDENAIPDREWQAQERALRAERLHLSDATDDADTHAYRVVARALRQAPASRLPEDFAMQVSRLAAAERRGGTVDRIDSLATTLLFALLAVGGIVLATHYDAAWWRPLLTLVPDSVWSNPWLPSLAACAAVTALLSRWRRIA